MKEDEYYDFLKNIFSRTYKTIEPPPKTPNPR